MTACNSDKCHCPQCNEARRERTQDARIGSLETRVDRLEDRHNYALPSKAAAVRRHDYQRERAERYIPTEGQRMVKCTGPRGRIYVGYKEAPNLEWRWEQQGPDRWCRRMVDRPYHYLGRPVYRRYFTPDGRLIKGPAGSSGFASGGYVHGHGIPAGEGLIGGMKIVEGHKPRSWAESNPNSAESWLRDKFEEEGALKHGAPSWHLTPPCAAMFPTMTPFTELKKDSPTMSISASALAVLTYIHAHSPRANDPDITGRQARDGYNELLQCDLIESFGAVGPRLTQRGEVLIRAIRSLPLPVREEAPWVMPKA